VAGNRSELRVRHGTRGVWTGARSPADTPLAEGHCSDWLSREESGRMGMSGYTTSFFFDNAEFACDSDLMHLYCMER